MTLVPSQGKMPMPKKADAESKLNMATFARNASLYAQSRPRYPEELFEYLAGVSPGRDLAWDAATGNGQAALALAGRYRRVVANDISGEQLAEAERKPNIDYRHCGFEEMALEEGAVDLLTVGTALHWFDLEFFYTLARRALKKGGIVAIFGYSQTRIDSAIDLAVAEMNDEVMPFWPPAVRILWSGYKTIPFPFEELDAPEFNIVVNWSRDDMLGYLGTWSAVGRYRNERGCDPLAPLAEKLTSLWGGGRKTVVFPLALRVGRNR